MKTQKLIIILRRVLYAFLVMNYQILIINSFAQGVAINTTGAEADNSALLDLNSTGSPYKGTLITRLTTENRDLIASPAEGLLIYNITTQCYEGYNAAISTWVAFGCIGCLPGALTASAASGITETSFSANWTASDGATTYYLDVSTSSTFESCITSYSNLNVGNVLTNSVTGLSCNTTYYYRVRANNTCGTSENSNKATVTSTACWACGNSLSITHTGGTVAPETKTVNYGTVTTNLSGASKCWISQNLGSTNQASSASDATDAAAGWYWQFNRKQGYKIGPTPTWTITSISETSDWLPANDPCIIELGTSWRIPTYTEWLTADGAPQNWANYTDTYNSVLKLHAAGYLNPNNGVLGERGTCGYSWSSTQTDVTSAWDMWFRSSGSFLNGDVKATGFPIRCIKDNTPPTFSCGSSLPVTHTLGNGIAPETKIVNYGTVTSSISGTSKCWITQNLGSTNQATSATDATEASAGWYWQFNRKQGYKVGPTPSWTITSINETSDWLPANDPCTIELGAGWRIPTNTEWTAAIGSPQNWANYTDTYNSVLKLHAAGYMRASNGSLDLPGSNGYCWSSTQGDNIDGWFIYFYSSGSGRVSDDKAYGYSLRCLKD
ncbi:MAG: hypothetical protein HGB12_13485 [Bacteroidetes bacterium]|nr:hypothetical protein [Bacteroidota bacterium]